MKREKSVAGFQSYAFTRRHLMGEHATPLAARPLARRAAKQLVGIAGYSSSSRLALYPMEHTANGVQLPFLS